MRNEKREKRKEKEKKKRLAEPLFLLAAADACGC